MARVFNYKQKLYRLAWIVLATGMVWCSSLHPAAAAQVAPAPVTVTLDDNYPPYIFRADNGELKGILKDTWDLWSVRTGIPVRLQAMDWNQAILTMNTGQADVIDTIFETTPRKRIYDFSAAYAKIDVPIFFHESISGIVDAASLKGFNVSAKAGDACIDYLRKQGVTAITPYPSYEDIIRAAANNEVRIFCMDTPPAMYFLYKYGLEKTFRYSEPMYTGEFHWAVHKGDTALKKILEDGFAHISPEDRQRIEDKWLGTSSMLQSSLAFRYVAYVLLAIFAVALLLISWNLSLRRLVVGKTSELTRTLEALQEAKQESEDRLYHSNAILEAIPDLLFELDEEGRYLDYRASRLDLLAAPPEVLMGRTVAEILPPEAADTVMEALRQAAENGASYGTQICLELPGGEHWFELSAARTQPRPGKPITFIMLSRDITERKRAAAEIEQLAYFDALTQLPNRRLIFSRLRQALSASLRHHTYGALLFIDLDDFKTLNDTKGHKIGDLLLKEVALRLAHCVRVEDSIARLGGDEFVILLEELGPSMEEAASQAEGIAEKVLDRIRQPFPLDNLDHHATGSIGICLFSGQTESEDELLKRADAAMYRAKKSGRNTWCFFDPSMQATLEAKAKLEMELRRALPEGQFALYYQAQVDGTDTILGAEVLLRWLHPQQGMISPLQFIPLAEETGLIGPIGHWVLEEACRRLKQWQQDPLTRALILSINVSARQFRQVDFVQQVSHMLTRYDIEPSRLKLELTESLVLDNVADSIEKMHALKAVGVPFSMDDFGTGYSSLSYLKRLPLDQLKIDQSFVRDIVTDAGDAIIVQTIIGMAHNLGLDVIAEGVETMEQKEFLLRNDCSKFQGYLFSRPLPLAEFEALLPRRPA
ncbi:MAG: EAL domain-containing protein [Rhodocyclaceae bacterium]|nr:MAG: EAL domain-containing protein [Rhodocyclaceae bacterium]